jgi:hypothetical protein
MKLYISQFRLIFVFGVHEFLNILIDRDCINLLVELVRCIICFYPNSVGTMVFQLDSPVTQWLVDSFSQIKELTFF